MYTINFPAIAPSAAHNFSVKEIEFKMAAVSVKRSILIGHSEIAQGTGASFKFQPIDKLKNHHMKDHVKSSHLTKFDACRVNIDQVIDLETWFKIHTNVSNVETASPQTI